MPGFEYSSSPLPSTPDRRFGNNNNLFSFAASNNPSTTPAGPPPSSAASFTPVGPPPSSIFGSSGNVKPLSFSQRSTFDQSQLESPKFTSSPNFGRSTQPYRASSRRNIHDLSNSEEEEGEDDSEYLEADGRAYGHSQGYDDDGADEMSEDEDGRYEEDEDMEDYRSRSHQASRRSGSDLLLNTPAAFGKSTGNELADFRRSLGQSISDPNKASRFGAIAKELYKGKSFTEVTESDELILNTEAIVTRLYAEGVGPNENEAMLQRALAVIPGELTTLWADYDRKTTVYNSEPYKTTIGPGRNASDFARANFLAHLALQIYHPKPLPNKAFEVKFKPLPQIMLEWLDEHHDPYPSQLEELQAYRPSPSNHRLFWATILNGLIRGKVVAVVQILKNAGWSHSFIGLDDMNDNGQAGYTGVALENIEKVIHAACQVLSQCPAVHGDWDVSSSDWTLFRLRISQAEEDLRRFAEGTNHGSAARESEFGISAMASRAGRYSKIAQKAESQVPWHIYQNLLTLYSIVTGDSTAIIENSQDWCEASIGLLVWRDEGKDERRLVPGRSMALYRSSLRNHDSETYLKRLRRSFDTATSGSGFELDSVNPVEVGLACLFEGDSEAVVGLLRLWSGPVSCAVAEVASLAGWLPWAEPQSLITMGSLSPEDLNTLGVQSSPSKADGIKDQTLIAYSRSLLNLDELVCPTAGKGEMIREGWELSLAILGRLDSTQRSEEKIGEFLSQFELDSAQTVDKLWSLLNDLGMTQYAENTAESYADMLKDQTHKYGEVLWYYALAHKLKKVKDVLDLLISFSLIQSTAYPPEAELDEHLQHLITSPKAALTQMSGLDLEAAELLHKMLSGYATIRKFYNLRDAEVTLPKGQKPSFGPIARKLEAASALLAVITSSDDNVRGGLYDEGRGAVVSIDFLLALLGEAMVFVNQPSFILTASQISTLLRAIEDIQAVGPRIYSGCTEFLQTVISSAQGLSGSSPSDMLRKSTSSMSGTSGSFEMVGSSMYASQFQRSIRNSGVIVKANIKRGWDWREGVQAGTSAEDVLRILRLGLAKDLAKAWLKECDSRA